MHVDFEQGESTISQSSAKVQNETLECTLDELAVLRIIQEDPTLTQQDIQKKLGKTLSFVKRATLSLQEKGYIERVGGKRYGRWEILK